MRPSAQELPVQMPKRAQTCGLWTICSMCRFTWFNKSAALFWNLSHSNIVFMIALMYYLDVLLGVLTPERSGTAVLEATGDAIKQTKYSFQVHFETLRGGFWRRKCDFDMWPAVCFPRSTNSQWCFLFFSFLIFPSPLKSIFMSKTLSCRGGRTISSKIMKKCSHGSFWRKLKPQRFVASQFGACSVLPVPTPDTGCRHTLHHAAARWH